MTDADVWFLPSREPSEVISHGDFAPSNSFAGHVAEGHDIVYLADIDHMRASSAILTR